MYDLDFDAPSATLRLRLTDFWTEALMRRFTAELMARVASARRVAPRLVILSDCRDYPVQSPQVGMGWTRLLGVDSPIVEPYAVVVGSMLNKLQAERVLLAPNLRVFTDMGAASAWLVERRGE